MIRTLFNFHCNNQRWSRGHKPPGQGQGRKNIRSQGKGQTLSSPRTGMLEAKAKDQGHRRKCSQKKKYFQAFSKRKISGVLQKKSSKNFSGDLQNLNNSKSSAVLEPRTGQFSRTGGFEGMAKDFKMCPRGQGRPRGLHLWQAVHSPLNKKMKKNDSNLQKTMKKNDKTCKKN